MSKFTKQPFDVLILTAVPDEYEFLQRQVVPDASPSQWVPVNASDKIPMIKGLFRRPSGSPLAVLVSRSYGMGHVKAERRIRDLEREFAFRGVAMCGVCAGRPKSVKQGDVIAASHTWHWGPGKETSTYTERGRRVIRESDVEYLRIAPTHWQYSLLDYRNHFLAEFGDSLKAVYPAGGVQPYAPAVHVGYMQTVPDVTLDEKAFIRANTGKRPTIGLEMEGIGVANAVCSLNLEFWILAKGVQDFARPKLGKLDKDEDDIYRPLAASASACFVVEFLRRHLTESSLKQRNDSGAPRQPRSTAARAPIRKALQSHRWSFDPIQNVFSSLSDRTHTFRIIRLTHAASVAESWFTRACGSFGVPVTVEEVINGQIRGTHRFACDHSGRVYLPIPESINGHWVIDPTQDSIAAILNSATIGDEYLVYRTRAGLRIS